MQSILLPTAVLLASLLPPADLDSDHDGLSDFQERTKYFTDPRSSDSDGDGVPDGDWFERREYTYTVRAVIQVAPPVTPDVFCDDYQDARVLDRTDRYVEIEAILYPLNRVAETIQADPQWRSATAAMSEWTRPGPTANWDETMRKDLLARLAAAGVDAAVLDDRSLVEQASKWLLEHAKYSDGFTTFCTRFVDGRAQVHPGLEHSARSGQADKNLTLEQQWQRELFAKGMFENGVRGSCTSSAIYLNGCLRALGIPTRIVLAVPIIDASDPRERQLASRLKNHQVRYTIQRGTTGLENSWSSHTFNEVYVGGRWRRLNYDRLGQNILDPGMFGLIVHVATFSDWADGNMASTWGLRQAASDRSEDPFGGPNPYSTVALSDAFGVHAKIDNSPAPDDYAVLTIDAACWFSEHPAGVDMRLDDPDTAGHVVVRVEEGRAGEGTAQYQKFYDRVSKDFVLRAEGRPDVPLQATRGYWAAPEQGLKHFYLRIEPDAFASMADGVAYTLSAVPSDAPVHWSVRPGVTLTRTSPPPTPSRSSEAAAGAEGPSGAAHRAAGPGRAADGAAYEWTIDQIVWSDAPDSPTGNLGTGMPVLLARAGAAGDFDALKAFTQKADLRYFLEAQGHPTLKVSAAIGGVTTKEHSYLVIQLGPGDWRDLVPGVQYTLRAQNESKGYQWKCAGTLRTAR